MIMENKDMPFNGTPSQKYRNGAIESKINQPPHQTYGFSYSKGITSVVMISIHVQRIIENFDAECEEKENNDDMIV